MSISLIVAIVFVVITLADRLLDRWLKGRKRLSQKKRRCFRLLGSGFIIIGAIILIISNISDHIDKRNLSNQVEFLHKREQEALWQQKYFAYRLGVLGPEYFFIHSEWYSLKKKKNNNKISNEEFYKFLNLNVAYEKLREEIHNLRAFNNTDFRL